MAVRRTSTSERQRRISEPSRHSSGVRALIIVLLCALRPSVPAGFGQYPALVMFADAVDTCPGPCLPLK